MITDQNKFICETKRANACRQCYLRRFVDDAVIEGAAREQRTGSDLRM